MKDKKLSAKMQELIADLPLTCWPIDSARKEDDLMEWQGESGKAYQTSTIRALVKRGLIQYIKPVSGYLEFVLKEKHHESQPFISWNELFIPTERKKIVSVKDSLEDAKKYLKRKNIIL